MPAVRAEGVDGAVRVPDEDSAVCDRGRGVEVLAAAEARERRRVPALTAGLPVDAVDAPVRGGDDHEVPRARRSGDDLVVGGERPLEKRSPLAADPVRVEVRSQEPK